MGEILLPKILNGGYFSQILLKQAEEKLKKAVSGIELEKMS